MRVHHRGSPRQPEPVLASSLDVREAVPEISFFFFFLSSTSTGMQMRRFLRRRHIAYASRRAPTREDPRRKRKETTEEGQRAARKWITGVPEGSGLRGDGPTGGSRGIHHPAVRGLGESVAVVRRWAVCEMAQLEGQGRNPGMVDTATAFSTLTSAASFPSRTSDLMQHSQ